ncbi:MAG: hypothetical protein IPK84_01405 [Candidatus Moraniibacteriota bacterium]|nr:MAG: hypothetical protein IPK84_01405 [Candidatus Moranbacteria bacterium]
MSIVDSTYFVIGTLFGVVSGFFIGGSLVMLFNVKPLRERTKLLSSELDEIKEEWKTVIEQRHLWAERANDQARKAQDWLRRFQAMVEMATNVFMDEDDISPEGKRTVVVRPTEFSSARLIITENSSGRDEVVIELRKPCGENIRSFNVHFIPCARLGVDAIDEDYWIRGGSEGDFFEVLCANHLNTPPAAGKGEEVKKWQPGFRAE